MRLFNHFFRDTLPPLTALREAQLAIYRHPVQIGALATGYGPDIGKTVAGGRHPRPINLRENSFA